MDKIKENMIKRIKEVGFLGMTSLLASTLVTVDANALTMKEKVDALANTMIEKMNVQMEKQNIGYDSIDNIKEGLEFKDGSKIQIGDRIDNPMYRNNEYFGEPEEMSSPIEDLPGL